MHLDRILDFKALKIRVDVIRNWIVPLIDVSVSLVINQIHVDVDDIKHVVIQTVKSNLEWREHSPSLTRAHNRLNPNFFPWSPFYNLVNNSFVQKLSYRPAFVMIISVPRLWNSDHSSRQSNSPSILWLGINFSSLILLSSAKTDGWTLGDARRGAGRLDVSASLESWHGSAEAPMRQETENALARTDRSLLLDWSEDITWHRQFAAVVPKTLLVLELSIVKSLAVWRTR